MSVGPAAAPAQTSHPHAKALACALPEV
jgi:hypothetical protein